MSVEDPDTDTGADPNPPSHLADLAGMDLVRRALEEARAAARGQGKQIGQGRRSPKARRSAQPDSRRRWSGPGPDGRDPQPLGRVANELSNSRGWSPRVAEGTVFAQWIEVVGADIADHAVPTALRDGVLSVTAESTAWATQLRIVQSQLLAKIAAAVGDGVVTALRITGPSSPSWRKGPRHIPGRGPRDTYG